MEFVHVATLKESFYYISIINEFARNLLKLIILYNITTTFK